MHATKYFSLPIDSCFVLGVKVVDEVLCVAFAGVFDSKVIDNEAECDVVRAMAEKSRGMRCGMVAPFR